MVVSDCEDKLTKVNKYLNETIEKRDQMNVSPKQSKKRKSVTINMSNNVTSNEQEKNSQTRKSILKTSNKRIREENESSEETKNEEESQKVNTVIPEIFIKQKQLERRPLTLDEFMKNDSLTVDPTAPSFTMNAIDEDDELWLFNIPKTINPYELKGQTLYFGDRSKFKVGNERYIAVSNDNSDYFTCIMATGRESKRFKTVNVQPSGTITVRKKLSNIGSQFSINNDDEEITSNVPFPDNLRIRHPLLGARKTDKRIKRSSSNVLQDKIHKSEI